MTQPVTEGAQLLAFREMAQSLKLYRRAELISDEGESLIEQLYVDPLPNDHVLVTMLKPSTTFLIGRKGTGKSTIFQRAQHELRRTAGAASAYVDIPPLNRLRSIRHYSTRQPSPPTPCRHNRSSVFSSTGHCSRL